MIAGDPEVRFPEISSMAGDHSKRYAWDLVRFVSPDVDLKRKEDCSYGMSLTGGVRFRRGR